MEKKRDKVAVLLETICWIALMGAEFFFLFSFLPWNFLWVFLILTLMTLLFAVGRRKLSERKVFLRVFGIVLAVFSAMTGWICFEDASQAAQNLWWTEDPAHYERLRGIPFSASESRLDFFPYSIPEYATEIKFRSNPRVLQGGSVFSLEFCAPREEVEKWEKIFKEKADYPGSYLNQGLTASDMAASIGYSREFSAYVIYAGYQHAGCQPANNPPVNKFSAWNHGKIYYGAVNFDTNRVYFYESVW